VSKEKKLADRKATRALIQDPRHDEAAALAGIKAVFAAGPTLTIPERPVGLIGRGPGAVEKVSPGGQHIGWYREGQKVGGPTKDMPLARDIAAAENAYLDEVVRAVAATKRPGAAGGKASGVARAKRSIKAKATAERDRLEREGVAPRIINAKIAGRIGITKDHARVASRTKK